jgi:hypothetical protein
MKCLICGGRVPQDAADCPTCGSPSPRSWYRGNRAAVRLQTPEVGPDPDSRSARVRGDVTMATEDLLSHERERRRVDRALEPTDHLY